MYDSLLSLKVCYMKFPLAFRVVADVADQKYGLLPQYDMSEEGSLNLKMFDADGNRKFTLEESGEIVELNSSESAELSFKKHKTYELLSAKGIKVPDFKYVEVLGNSEDAIVAKIQEVFEFVEEIGFPVVIKPDHGSRSKDVCVIFDIEELLERLIEMMQKYPDGIIVQKYVYGNEYRVIIFDGNVVCVYERASDGMIVSPENTVTVSSADNVSNEHMGFFLKVAQELGLDFCGIDVKDGDLSSSDISTTCVLEANSNPSMNSVSKLKGVNFLRDLYGRIIEFVLKNAE
jgi:glutathione synthase/RimK-type ligase-like ATP-grasp enzyme